MTSKDIHNYLNSLLTTARLPLRLARPPQLSRRELRDEVLRMVG